MKQIIKESIRLLDPLFRSVGLLRTSSNGLWMIDREYYVIIVELQPNAYRDSIFINTAVCFLWEKDDDLNGVLTFDISHRISIDGQDNIVYDDFFNENVINYAHSAIRYISDYYDYQNVTEARKEYYQRKLSSSNADFWDYYDYSMLCFLDNDLIEGRRNFDLFLIMLKQSIYEARVIIEWKDKLYKHSVEEVLPYLSNQGTANDRIRESIKTRRQILSQNKKYSILCNK